MKILIALILAFIILSCSDPSQYQREAKRLFNENKYESALIEINKVIDLEPDSVVNYVFRAMVYGLMGSYKESISDLDKIIKLKPKEDSLQIYAYQQRAFAKIKIGLYKEALMDIDYSIKKIGIGSNLISSYMYKAGILYKLNDFKNSEKFYKLVLKENNGKVNSVESDALIGLANLTKSPQDALNLLNKAILIDEKNASAYISRAAIFIDIKQINEAYKDSKRAISLKSKEPILYSNLGQIFMNYYENLDSAKFYFEKAIFISPQSPDNDNLYMNLGVIKHRAGNLHESLSDFEKSEIINPKNDLLLYNMSMLLSDMNNNKASLEKINSAISINHNDPDYFNYKGTILMSLSSFDDAEKEFMNAIKVNPNFGGAFYNLGYLYGEQNKQEQSIKYYNKAVLLNFNLETTLVNLALEKIKLKDLSSACSDLKRAYKLGRTDILPLINKYCN